MLLLMVMFFCSEFQIVHSSFAKNTNNKTDVTQQTNLQTSCLSNPKLCFQTIYKGNLLFIFYLLNFLQNFEHNLE